MRREQFIVVAVGERQVDRPTPVVAGERLTGGLRNRRDRGSVGEHRLQRLTLHPRDDGEQGRILHGPQHAPGAHVDEAEAPITERTRRIEPGLRLHEVPRALDRREADGTNVENVVVHLGAPLPFHPSNICVPH
ncbi:Uncharacterised protein [Mycobacteroides abscessus subsp. abscessus]|nr:Uncharacterised protein [Mycobacteroides abscessus subsp. abscessus]